MTRDRSAAPAAHERIEALAYQFWVERGSPLGSPETDWHRAEEQLKQGAQAGYRAA